MDLSLAGLVVHKLSIDVARPSAYTVRVRQGDPNHAIIMTLFSNGEPFIPTHEFGENGYAVVESCSDGHRAVHVYASDFVSHWIVSTQSVIVTPLSTDYPVPVDSVEYKSLCVQPDVDSWTLAMQDSGGRISAVSDGGPVNKWILFIPPDSINVPGWTQINVRFVVDGNKFLLPAININVEQSACTDELEPGLNIMWKNIDLPFDPEPEV